MAYVVIVDDEEDIRKGFCVVLERAGHEVATAATVDAALGSCRGRAPDVVVTDVFMPEKDGYELLWALKRDFPRVRVVAVTGGGRWSNITDVGQVLRAAERFGAVCVLRKPVRGAELCAAVAAAERSPTPA